MIGYRHHLFVSFCVLNTTGKQIQIGSNFVYPTLRVSLFGCSCIHFSDNGNTSCDVSRLRLRSTHTPQSRGNKKFSGKSLIPSPVFRNSSSRIEDSNVGAMNNSL